MARIYTEEYRAERDKRRNEWLLGNHDAINFIQILTDAAELWDDLTDKDREIQPHELDNAFLGLLIGLPTNGFFLQNSRSLVPLMVTAINAWKDSEILKDNESVRLRRIAFQQRFMLFEITKFCAFLIGGWDHLRKVSPDICQFYAYEDFEEFNAELKHA